MAIKGSKKVAIGVFQQAAEEYLAECKAQKKVPFLSMFAEKLDIDDTTLSRYAHFAEYAKCIKKIKLASENALIYKALSENKPIFPIFLLKSKFGYIEQQKLDITSDGQALGVVQLPARTHK